MEQNQFRNWIEQFHKDGFLVLPEILDQKTCDQLKFDLDKELQKKFKEKYKTSRFIRKRMFEVSQANLELFWKEPIVTFAEQLIGDTRAPDQESYEGGVPAANEVHVIHNNSFKIPPESEGLGRSSWHQDDTPHAISLDGKPMHNIQLNVLCFTCLYYLTDVLTIDNGPTEVIRGSHLFGKACTGDITGYENRKVTCLGSAGTAVMFNNQVWHRGARNNSDQARYVTQITYAKRLVGHKYGTFMNYVMPSHVYSKIHDKRKSRLLGFLSHGAYG